MDFKPRAVLPDEVYQHIDLCMTKVYIRSLHDCLTFVFRLVLLCKGFR